ncbi:MAG: D-alanyl-D-alanine carboxypeptidase [Geminicoccaceae bacterium]|nr:D-alanyl-D-alanine carboxypeptidase [Geminicoccaceae bacterium]MCS7268452.1 D-alanyl-D-alanine carboxypeptidase [Geminicoccaceae bacterium]MCX7631064.1 D-alanyl-D-alanine carboxypeptidase [Geminicoccaceae bacterium]MDW8124896.1 D-alanyl-D-alanine carboxypeptidase family protein [Geminicoccaceae bacterium]MDW8340944.1 D-alanyl-D-alanine carboxypeptidase family protein [Geminicoccaceae bacterium]
MAVRSWVRALGIVLVLLASGGGSPGPAVAFETSAKAAIVIDHRTGQELFAKNPRLPVYPASMSKLMTALLVFEEIKAGRLKLDDALPVSEKAWRTGGSKMFVRVGERVKVSDLLRGMIVQSGNDACVVFAEALAGSEAAFAERMNRRAAEIGLTDSRFKNATGLHDPEHVMSVRDLATLTSKIIREHPDLYRIYSEKEFEYAKIRQHNRNPLLQAGVPGVDGVKTGYTEEAGYGLVVSAERDGRRVILVLAGLETLRQRRSEAELLLEWAFREFQEYRLFAAGETVVEVPVWLGASWTVPAVPRETIGITLRREERPGLKVTARYTAPLPAPVTQGDEIARLEIAAPGRTPITVPLVAGRSVERAGLFGRLAGALAYLVQGGGV